MSRKYMAQPPDYGEDVVLLAGAGASQFLGLDTVDRILAQSTLTLKDAETNEILIETRKAIETRKNCAVFEELIHQLRFYRDIAGTLRTDRHFQSHLGQVSNDVLTGAFEKKWMKALTEAYRILISEYGPHRINPKSSEFHATAQLLGGLAQVNGGTLQLYTTNYDCSYQVLACQCDALTFVTHINSNDGSFTDHWWFTEADVKSAKYLRCPPVYVHRLHGCVAWFSDPESPHRIHENYGAGGPGELTADDDDLHKMCIKLVTTREIGMNPGFHSAFHEFSTHLKNAKCLLVWGHSFRDVEVLRAINSTLSARSSPLPILFLNPFLEENDVMQNIQRTLAAVPVPIEEDLHPRRIDWRPSYGTDKLVTNTLLAIQDACDGVNRNA